MHNSSLDLMAAFVSKHVPPAPALAVLDVGSMDVNGTYRSLFNGHNYRGLDVEPGPNVDFVGGLYDYPFPNGTFDVVISGQTIEHVENLHRWIREVARVAVPGGLMCIIGPNTFSEHKHPVDCWRVWPDGMRFLLGQIAALEVLECRAEGIDTIGIARKRRQ